MSFLLQSLEANQPTYMRSILKNKNPKNEKCKKIETKIYLESIQKDVKGERVSRPNSFTNITRLRLSVAAPLSFSAHSTEIARIKRFENQTTLFTLDQLSCLSPELLNDSFKNFSTDQKILQIKLIVDSNQLTITKIFKILETFFDDPNFFLYTPALIWVPKFCILLFQDSEYALTLLKNERYKLREIPFGYSFEIKFKNLALLGIPGASANHFAQCIDLLSENKSIPSSTFHYMLASIIEKDLPLVAVALARASKINQFQHEVIRVIFDADSRGCLEAFFKLWNHDFKKVIDEFLQTAVDASSARCILYLTQHFDIDPQIYNQLILEASKIGNAKIMIALCKNNYEETAHHLFADICSWIPNKQANTDRIEHGFFKILRMSPLTLVQHCVEITVKSLKLADKLAFEIAYNQAKERFLKLAPFIARYTKKNELYSLENSYDPSKVSDHVIKDLQHASFCLKRVEEILEDLNAGKIKTPVEEPYKGLPKSSKGTQRVATLLEKFALIRYKIQLKRCKNDLALESFRTFRKIQCYTPVPVAGLYKQALLHLSSVFHYSQATDVLFSGTRFVYFYNNIPVNQIWGEVIGRTPEEDSTYNFSPSPIISHGFSSVQHTWGSIENLFEEILTLKLESPKKDSPIALKKAHEQNLAAFYKKAVEFVWLLGNTQPMERGSGSFAEWMRVIIHNFHGLPVPILKDDFPHLDINNTNFPLSDYHKIFYSFLVEPLTLPKHLVASAYNLRDLPSVYAQLEDIYTFLTQYSNQFAFHLTGKSLDTANYDTPPSVPASATAEKNEDSSMQSWGPTQEDVLLPSFGPTSSSLDTKDFKDFKDFS